MFDSASNPEFPEMLPEALGEGRRGGPELTAPMPGVIPRFR